VSFQAYLDTIKAQTGKGPEEFRALAAEKGLVGPKAKAGDVIAWLSSDFGLGRGHAMALYSILKADGAPRKSAAERLDRLFSGARAARREDFDALLAQVRTFGEVGVEPTDTYASLLRGRKKFAIVQPTAARLDVGIKRPGAAPTDRFAASGAWNAMVTHRMRLEGGAAVDAELLDWLRQAWDAAG
jgi:hypothetical protein